MDFWLGLFLVLGIVFIGLIIIGIILKIDSLKLEVEYQKSRADHWRQKAIERGEPSVRKRV